MILLRLFLLICLVANIAYTSVTVANHGWELFTVFFADLAAMAWPGQFNLDFSMMLMTSGLWVAWRHRFSAAGLGLALLAATGGMLFLSIYLLIVSFQTNGDAKMMLLGDRAHT